RQPRNSKYPIGLGGSSVAFARSTRIMSLTASGLRSWTITRTSSRRRLTQRAARSALPREPSPLEYCPRPEQTRCRLGKNGHKFQQVMNSVSVAQVVLCPDHDAGGGHAGLMF